MFVTAEQFLRWWGGELAGLLPRRLVAWLAGKPRAVRVIFHPDVTEAARVDGAWHLPFNGGLADSLSPFVAPALRAGTVVDVVLPEAVALTLSHSLPTAARGRLSEILTLEIGRCTPLALDSIAWTHRLVAARDGRLEVAQYVVRRRDLDQLRDALPQAGLILGEVRLRTAAGELGPLTWQGSVRPLRERVWGLANLALGGVAVVLLGWLALGPHFERRAELTTLRAENARLRAEAVALRRDVDAAHAARAAGGAVERAVAAAPSALATLAELTALLPDTAWATEIEVTQGALRFSGLARGSAAELAIGLAASQLFENPRLSGPVAIAPDSGEERFDIAVDLRGSG